MPGEDGSLEQNCQKVPIWWVFPPKATSEWNCLPREKKCSRSHPLAPAIVPCSEVLMVFSRVPFTHILPHSTHYYFFFARVTLSLNDFPSVWNSCHYLVLFSSSTSKEECSSFFSPLVMKIIFSHLIFMLAHLARVFSIY